MSSDETKDTTITATSTSITVNDADITSNTSVIGNVTARQLMSIDDDRCEAKWSIGEERSDDDEIPQLPSPITLVWLIPAAFVVDLYRLVKRKIFG